MTAGQPDRAHEIYPVNDHVADKATYSDFLELFSDNVYNGGALVLYALHNRIGERKFYELEREWAKRFGGESATTFDFIGLAAKVSRDPGVVPFLIRWLYDDTVPPMPGHPDWVSPPATVAAAATASRLSARGLEVARILKR